MVKAAYYLSPASAMEVAVRLQTRSPLFEFFAEIPLIDSQKLEMTARQLYK
jgi:DUF1365 family protein